MAASRHPWSSALVTGASSGIGQAFVELLVAAGVPTVAVARRADRLAGLAEGRPLVEPLVADLHDEAGRARVAARLADVERPIALLVNNAGFGATGSFASVPAAAQLEQIDLNCSALVSLTHAALAAPGPGDGRRWILNVSSVAGFVPSPRAAVYAATKAFVTSFSEALAEEVRSDAVRVCALCPGLTRSEFHARAAGYSERAGLGSDAPGWAWMTAEAVAEAGLRGVEAGRVVVVPGAVNRLLTGGAALLPRGARRRLAARVRRR
ncbi:MAG: SDR family NAD(P)-dependent oxidoreductase [Acidimicrobiales bacterium]|nr:SDR family NAD(P)-dependent oxidoreductase [Acidimicrobiales bacterium]